MKKNNLFILTVSLFLLASCGNNNPSNVPSGSIEMEDGYLYVRVLNPDGTPAVGSYVRWCEGEMCYNRVKVDNNGYARIIDRNTTYDVHLSLPSGTKYTYNPYEYTQDSSTQLLEITLQNVQVPTFGDGSDYSTYVDGHEVGGPYHINKGIYRTTIESSKKEDIQYFRFTPDKPGTYVIESWADPTDVADPVVGNYGNSPSFLFYNDGDDDSGHDQNFRYEFMVLPDNFELEYYFDEDENVCLRLDDYGHPILKTDENGKYIPSAAYTFGLSSKNAFAVSYVFNVSYVKEYTYVDTYVADALVNAKLTKFDDKDSELVDFDLTSTDTAVLNEEDGYYHLNDENGPIVVTHISSKSRYIDENFSTIEQNTGTAALTVKEGKKSYSKFIAEYAKYCNSDGVYPLNEELITFLKELAEARIYFGEYGWISGSISEAMGDTPYTLNSDSDYLYACAYYDENGDIDNPRTIGVSRSGTYSTSIKEGDSFYYAFTPKKDIKVTLTPDETTLIKYNDITYSKESPLIIDTTKGEKYVFALTRVDGLEGKVLFDVTVPPLSEQMVIGENQVETTFTGVEITLTNKTSETQTYHIYSEDSNCLLVSNTNQNYVGGSSNNGFTFTLNPNETYTYYVCTYDYVLNETMVTFVIEIVSL